MNKRILILFVIVIIVLGVTVWKLSLHRVGDVPAETPTEQTGQALFEGKSFNLVAATIDGKTMDLREDAMTVSFDDQKVTGVICNSFNGMYGVGENNRLSAEKLISTKKFCEATMPVETAFFDSLAQGLTTSTTATGLVLTSDAGASFTLEAQK